MDAKLAEHAAEIKAIIHGHIDDEMDRYREILDTISAHKEDSETRHAQMSQSLMNYAERMDTFFQGIALAFPKGPDGKPDYHGHGEYHSMLIERDKEEREWRRQVRGMILAITGTVIGAAIIGAFGVFIYWVRNGG